jgi:hypothetical protein
MTGLPTDWWTSSDVVAYLTGAGHRIVPSTWYAYRARGQAPAPDRHFGRSPVWRPDTIRTWHHNRPRAGDPLSAAGIVLTDELIQRYADEAEAGYDLEQLKPRPRPPGATTAERSLAGSIAANERWAKEPDREAATRPGRRAFMARFERLVDPDGVLAPDERARRAGSAKRAYFQRLALRSSRIRRLRKDQPD